MENIFITAAVVSVFFCIAKFIEMRFLDKDKDKDSEQNTKGLKLLVRDCLLVYVSVVCGYFILEQFTNVSQSMGGSSGKTTQVFTDNPEF